ncbi:MAG: hypothetical protein K9J13_03245 [Saprospiraceae bacterium]|nr:hypothetical protein [Saprospiraceae bacterium]
MRVSTTFLIIVFVSIYSYAQITIISLPKTNVAYLGIENQMNILAENSFCDSIIVKTNNGEIKSKNKCTYVYLPLRPEESQFYIYSLKSKDTIAIDTQTVRIKLIPQECIIPTVEFVRNGITNKFQLIASSGVGAYLDCFDSDYRYKVLNYTVQTFRNDTSFFFENEGNLFVQNLIIEFRLLESGDSVEISNINVIGGANIKRELKNKINFRIE